MGFKKKKKKESQFQVFCPTILRNFLGQVMSFTEAAQKFSVRLCASLLSSDIVSPIHGLPTLVVIGYLLRLIIKMFPGIFYLICLSLDFFSFNRYGG